MAATPSVIEGEVRYVVKHEYAQIAIDTIARRCHTSILNAQAIPEALPRVIEIMSEEWDARRRKREVEGAARFLVGSGLTTGAVPQASMICSVQARGAEGPWESMRDRLFWPWKNSS